jgi:hypothetical protein
VGEGDEQGAEAPLLGEPAEQLGGLAVEPLGVVDDEQDGSHLAGGRQPLGDGVEQRGGGGAVVGLGGPGRPHQRLELGDESGQLAPGGAQLVGLTAGIDVLPQALADGPQRVDVVLRAAAVEDGAPLVVDDLGQAGQHRGLPHPGFPAQHQQARLLAGLRRRPQLRGRLHDRGPADERLARPHERRRQRDQGLEHLGPPHPVDRDQALEPLELDVAQVLDRVPRPWRRQLAGRAVAQHLARPRPRRDACAGDGGQAEDVAFLDDHLAGGQADLQLDPLAGGQVAPGHGPLDGDRAPQRLAGRREGRERAVARGLDDLAVRLFDGAGHHPVALAPELVAAVVAEPQLLFRRRGRVGGEQRKDPQPRREWRHARRLLPGQPPSPTGFSP